MTMFKLNSFLGAAIMLLTFASCDIPSDFSYEIKNETNAPIHVFIKKEGYMVELYSRQLPAHSSEIFFSDIDYGPNDTNSEIYFVEFQPTDTFLILNANGDTMRKNHLDYANWQAQTTRNRRYYDHIYTFTVTDNDF